MLRPSNAPDPARLVSALGIALRPSVGAEHVAADLAALKERRIALGFWTEPAAPANEEEGAERLQRARDALAALVAEARGEAIARGDLWARTL